jgi:hypothetical protein
MPLTREQAVGWRILRDCEKNRRGERARAPVMNACRTHAVNRLSIAANFGIATLGPGI